MNNKTNFNSQTSTPNSGGIPKIGLGTYKLQPEQTYKSVRWALDIGYRHFDTAALYRNESSVGKAIRDSGCDFALQVSFRDRNSVFVTSKISFKDICRGNLKSAIENTLKNLDLDYVNLLLLHAPDQNVKSTWNSFCQLYQNEYKDYIQYIGVSNYRLEHLQMIETAAIQPKVNQIEVSPFLPRYQLRKYCTSRGIEIVAHSSLTKGRQLENSDLQKILDEYFPKTEITPAALLLKWALQQDIKIIPRSSQKDHLIANFNLPNITLSSELLKQMDKLNCGFATHKQHLN